MTKRLPADRALVEAAKEHLAVQPPSAIRGRDLAAAAGVNYGFVHRHFGTKQAVLHTALDELTDAFVAEAFAGPDGLPMPDVLTRHSMYWRAQTHVVLDPHNVPHHRPVKRTLDTYLFAVRAHRPELSNEASAAVVALGASLQLGACIHRQVLAPAAGLVADDDRIDEGLAEWLDALHEGRYPFDDLMPASVIERTPRELCSDTSDGTARERLVLAAARLLSELEPSAITGRRLAEEAEVNYGLVHHYFGGKRGLMQEAVQLHRDAFERSEDSRTIFGLCAHPGYVRAMTRASLDPAFAGEQRHPVIDRMLADADDDHARVRVFIVVATQLAWALYGPVFERQLGVRATTLESYARPLVRELYDEQRVGMFSALM